MSLIDATRSTGPALGRPSAARTSAATMDSALAGDLSPAPGPDFVALGGASAATPGTRLVQEQALQKAVIEPFLKALGRKGDRDLGQWVVDRAFDMAGSFTPQAVGAGLAKIVQARLLASRKGDSQGGELMQADMQFKLVASVATSSEELEVMCAAYATALVRGPEAARAVLDEVRGVRDDAPGNRVRVRSWSDAEFSTQKGTWLRVLGWTGSAAAADEALDLLAMPVAGESREAREQAFGALAASLRPDSREHAVAAYRCSVAWRQPGDDLGRATGRLLAVAELSGGDARAGMAAYSRMMQGVQAGAFGPVDADVVLERLVNGGGTSLAGSDRLEMVQAELARLARQSTENHVLQQGPEEVVIGGVRVPVRRDPAGPA